MEVLQRIADWMAQEAERGCLFHAAVAAVPRDERLHALLNRHKADVAVRAADISDLPENETDIALLIEGLTQSWPLLQDEAVKSALNLARRMYV